MSPETIALGIDIGTSGVRAAAIAADDSVLGSHAVSFSARGGKVCEPERWWQATCDALDGVLMLIDRERVAALAVDGTSGTLLAVEPDGTPRGPALMYDEVIDDAELVAGIARHLPAGSIVRGATSGLVKAHALVRAGARHVVHQADWIAGRLGTEPMTSDANNALKTGFDPVAHAWPEWIERSGLDLAVLPEVLVPGEPRECLSKGAAGRFSLPERTRLVAGTTDGCASFLATGAHASGEAVTALGSTLVLKMLCETPLFAPQYGLYSHRIGDVWLAGGASNSGGRVLAAHFRTEELARLSARIDMRTASGLHYYPLLTPGERFPINDPAYPPRLTPRPDDDTRFLHGLLEGLARIEALGYTRLAELGAPPLRSVRSVGGGAANPALTSIRRQLVGAPFRGAASTEAAVGTARLALRGLKRFESEGAR